MPPRIAIPMPHFSDPEYAERAIPQYERAIAMGGGEPVRIPLDRTPEEISKIVEHCDAVLLPGSKADVDPVRFHAERSPHTAAADPRRDVVDNLLLDDAHRLRKPVLGICYGLQSLNVYRAGSLVQHIPDFLPAETRAKVNHEAGGKIAVAHEVEIDPASKLAEIVGPSTGIKVVLDEKNVHEKNREGHSFSRAASTTESERALAPEGILVLPVNSSHHQSADAVGNGLRVVARCTADGIIEALEGTAPDHFVLAVQWHPERSAEEDAASRAIFRALLDAAKSRRR
ncbi:MAG: gamma-glutamyl-gamma-aminobutyrate hydrolase family protein [Candidatus Sulfotelmatobacter sp.]